MSDSVWRNRELSDEAQKLERDCQFEQAAELYKQSYDLYPSAFVTSRYIKCLRKQGKSSVAVEFGRQLPEQLRDNMYVHTALSWAVYDVYLKKAEIQNNDNEFDDVGYEKQNSSDFQKMQERARYIIGRLSVADDILRTRTVFAICNEAKLRGNWQVSYDFASQLDPERLSSEKQEWQGQKLPSDYQRWLYIMVRSLLELKRYDECIVFSRRGIEKFPNEKLFYWWQARAKLGLEQVEEALGDLEQIDTRFHREWYIQRDIADGYVRLQKYEEAWLWFCKAANSSRLEDLKGRFKMFQQMSVLLEQRGRWQEAYNHLQLAYAIVDQEHWEHPTEVLRGQLFQFRKHHREHITFPVDTSDDILSNLFRRCKASWQEALRPLCICRKGSISMVNEEKGFGFIKADNDEIFFQFRDVIKRIPLVKGTEVEFEIEKSYDQKKQRNSIKAVNIRPVRSRN